MNERLYIVATLGIKKGRSLSLPRAAVEATWPLTVYAASSDPNTTIAVADVAEMVRPDMVPRLPGRGLWCITCELTEAVLYRGSIVADGGPFPHWCPLPVDDLQSVARGDMPPRIAEWLRSGATLSITMEDD